MSNEPNKKETLTPLRERSNDTDPTLPYVWEDDADDMEWEDKEKENN